MKIIPKFQAGGGFESLFTVYSPPRASQQAYAAQASQPQKSTSKESDDEKGELTEKDFFNMLKEIDGLPNEMQSIVKNLVDTFKINKLTGIELSDLATTYLQSLYKIRQAADNKKKYDDSQKRALETGSMTEPAITADGKIITQDKEGKLNAVSLDTFMNNRDNYGAVLTVSNLLNLRAYSPSLANNFTVFDTVNSSIGYSEFQNLIKQAVHNLGTSETTNNGMFSNEGRASKGLALLQTLREDDRVRALNSVTAEGLYTYKIIDKSQKNQIESLTNYISALLPNNAKVWAALKLGTSDKEKATKNLILSYLLAGSNDSHTFEIDYKGSMEKVKGKTSSDSSSAEDMSQNTAVKWLRGLGVQEMFTINPGTNYATRALANTLPLTDKEKKYLGANSVLQQATSGEFAGILDFNSASMGMKKIDQSNFNKIILTDGKISSIDFPSKTLQDGTIVPDLSPETYEAKQKADKEIKNQGIDMSDIKSISDNYDTINKIYAKYQLYPNYNGDGVPTNNWTRFGVINASASNSALGMGQFDDNSLLQPITDDSVIDNLLQISKEEVFDKNEWYDINGTDHFYKGTVWIPINVSYVAASANVGMKNEQLEDMIVREQQLRASKTLTTEKK